MQSLLPSIYKSLPTDEARRAGVNVEAGQAESLLGSNGRARNNTVEDQEIFQRKTSMTQRICSAVLSIRSLLDVALILVVLGLLWNRGRQSSPRFEFGGDITGFAPRISQQIKTFSPDPSFIPVNGSDFFTDQVHERWLSIVPIGLGYIHLNTTTPYTSLPTPLTSYPPYTFTTSVTHQLHCLHAIAGTVAAYTSGKQPHGGEGWHMGHCLDYLRQSIMCCGDVALEGEQTTFPPGVGGSDGWDAKHVCRDWGEVVGYLEERRVDDQRWI